MWFLLTPWKAELQRKSNALEQANLSTFLGVRRHLHFLLLQVRPNCCHPQFLREPARSPFLGLHSGYQLKRTPARGGICTAQEPGIPQFRSPGKTALPLESYLLKVGSWTHFAHSGSPTVVRELKDQGYKALLLPHSYKSDNLTVLCGAFRGSTLPNATPL